jgi:AraC-like DNA-binding protein
MKDMVWTEEMVKKLTSEYNSKTDVVLSHELGVCTKTLTNKARSLGLVKDKPVRRRDMVAGKVCGMFRTHSLAEIAKETGVSVRTVSRIVRERGLTRTREEDRRINSRIRRELIARERGRVLFGLPQKTNIKVVCNRKRIALKSRMRKCGYVFHPTENILYYHEDMRRHPIRERNGAALGLRFYHLSYYLEHVVGLHSA